jgi:predicted RNA binding protein YcfA (HicA-like mRNA interferase family)
MVGRWFGNAAAIGQYQHPVKPGTVTVAGKPGDELHPKTAASILKQAGLRG